MTSTEPNQVSTATAVLDNGSFGTRTIRFETGRLAQQAAGAVAAYLDEDTMLLSATTAGKQCRYTTGGHRNHKDNETRGFHTLHFPQ